MHTQCVRVSEYMRRAKQSSKKMVGKIRKKKNTDIYEGSLKKNEGRSVKEGLKSWFVKE